MVWRNPLTQTIGCICLFDLTLYVPVSSYNHIGTLPSFYGKVQVGKDQEKAQSEKDSHSKNRGGKKPNQQSGTYTMKQFMGFLTYKGISWF